jgi:hypothetical protein
VQNFGWSFALLVFGRKLKLQVIARKYTRKRYGISVAAKCDFYDLRGGLFCGSRGLFSTSYPAASPNVVSVGGTTLSTNITTGAFLLENVSQSSGGGLSIYESRPAHQNGIPSTVSSYSKDKAVVNRNPRRLDIRQYR